MRRDFLVGSGMLASVAAGAGSAVAADMPVRPAAAPAAVSPLAPPLGSGSMSVSTAAAAGVMNHSNSQSLSALQMRRSVRSSHSNFHPMSIQRAVFSASSLATIGNGAPSSGAWKSTTAGRTSRGRAHPLLSISGTTRSRSIRTKRSTHWLLLADGSAT